MEETRLRTADMARRNSLVASSLALLLLWAAAAAAADSLQQQCAQAASRLLPCIDYGNGQSERPSSQCCGAARDMRGTQPACLCFMIQQAHNTSSSLHSFGLRVDRLAALPGACNLANSSVSDCPRLLNISRSSPDYSIFTNITAGLTSKLIRPSNISGGSSDSTAPSKAFRHRISLYGALAIGLATAAVCSILS
ncbi:non-specific lipid transfer protein GPI-anchored 1-like isoform X1 [Curcuma longa]|uniref:non-specific lipid transfer protein GPI-anchored 1-like isoform X1 n=1 Tax=Curcuma longa TaxID=136217 RepID=UPI003D9EF073